MPVLKKMFYDSLECHAVSQITLCANLLCAFKSAKQSFVDNDFQDIQNDRTSEKNKKQVK